MPQDARLWKVILEIADAAEPPTKRRKGVRHDINCKCSMKCGEKVDIDARQSIFNKFYSMQNKNQQDIYLQCLIETRNIKQKHKRNPDGESRSRSYSYFLSFPDRRVKVCQGMFTRIHAVSLDRLKVLNTKP
ncbi:hypothetical protein ILUMI_27428 [Ignelater luminosus]|uniref:Uncharacterized protein n=1 Tax=Ignelater luminosus TaxID=2038154 RepID=A0A8K0C4K4_IGNLU|nr:hypothetical protein ILUMI_27428 [Ignelater luminosus]